MTDTQLGSFEPIDVALLRVMRNKDSYSLLMPNIRSDVVDQRTYLLLKDFGKFFEVSCNDVIDPAPFYSFFNSVHPQMSSEVRNFYRLIIFNQLAIDPSPEITRSIYNRLLEYTLATDLMNLALQYQDGKEVDVIQRTGELHEKTLNSLKNTDEESFVSDDIDDLLQQDKNKEGLQFSLSCLRNNLRPLKTGDFVIVAARPDTGKTTFIASQLHSLSQGLPIDKDIIWFNNEGEGNRIIRRVYQGVLQLTTEEMIALSEQKKLKEKFSSLMGTDTRVRVKDCHGWNTTQVETFIRDRSPGLVIFDMIDNIRFGGTTGVREDQRLESQYQWARELGVKYHFPVIATSQVNAQADEQASTRCFPEMHMLKDSRTGKQGAADLIIMIGRSPDPVIDECWRYISTPKNKFANGNSSIREQVRFNKLRAQFLDDSIVTSDDLSEVQELNTNHSKNRAKDLLSLVNP